MATYCGFNCNSVRPANPANLASVALITVNAEGLTVNTKANSSFARLNAQLACESFKYPVSCYMCSCHIQQVLFFKRCRKVPHWLQFFTSTVTRKRFYFHLSKPLQIYIRFWGIFKAHRAVVEHVNSETLVTSFQTVHCCTCSGDLHVKGNYIM